MMCQLCLRTPVSDLSGLNRKRVIQYAAAVVLYYERCGVLDRPVKPGDDEFVVWRACELSPSASPDRRGVLNAAGVPELV
jgi:hypothetical protein